MKKRLLCIGAGLCCLLLLCACATGEVLQSDVSVHYDNAGAVSAPSQKIEISIDTTGLNKSYDAKPVEYPAYTSDLDTDPRVNYFWYQKTENGYVEIATPPIFVGEYKVVVKTVEDSTTDYVGEASALFSITPAIISPLSGNDFPYNGASVFVMENVAAMGDDRIGYEIAFEHCNVGARVSYIRFFGENSENYCLDPEYVPQITPRVLQITGLDVRNVQKTYDATDLVTLYFDADVHTGFLPGEGSALVVSTGVTSVCDPTQTVAKVQSTLNPNYRLVGDFSLMLEILPALFVPPTTVTYCGASEITLALPTGLGTDVLDVTLRFDGKDVGAVLQENGVSLGGACAMNYVLPATPYATIQPCVIDLSSLKNYACVKQFDGGDKLTLHLTNAEFAQIPTGEVLVLGGSVGQIGLCEAKEVTFRAIVCENKNFTISNTLTLTLTVKKATIKLSGALSLAYNGMSVRPLAADSEHVSGLSALAPVGLLLVFEGAEPGAALVDVKMFGENAEYYTLDLSGFTAEIRAVSLSLNAKQATFEANGESTRKLCNNQTYLLTTVAQGDDVYVLLTFSSAEAGAVLVSAELCGKDAYKYVLNTEGFTATLV